MLEVHDELMTPGCPQCAIKHLSAALFHRARQRVFPWPPRRGMEYVALACVNLYEVFVGYRSHLWYAVGALATAEEQAERGNAPDATIRDVRLMLEERGLDAVPEALERLAHGTGLSPSEWELAHLEEARRELPDFEIDGSDLVGSIERIREEFFTSGTTAPAAVTAEGGGESEMATKKAAKKAPAFLKKEDPKAKQAACKGGKCKGGKCKK